MGIPPRRLPGLHTSLLYEHNLICQISTPVCRLKHEGMKLTVSVQVGVPLDESIVQQLEHL
jgi:hypothetical protein